VRFVLRYSEMSEMPMTFLNSMSSPARTRASGGILLVFSMSCP